MGDKLYFLNSFYCPEKKGYNRDNGKYELLKEDFLMMTIKDCETNETYLKFIPSPSIDFYISKDPNIPYPRMSMKESELNKMTCLYRERPLHLARSLGLVKEYYEACRSKTVYEEGKPVNKSFRNEFIQLYLYNNPRLYLADIDLEDFAKNAYLEKYGRNIFKDFGQLKKSFMDIEVDQHDYTGPQCTGKTPFCPINLITYFFVPDNTLYYFILDNQPDNPILQSIKADPSEFILYSKELAHKEYIPILKFYNNEIDLIKGFFYQLHQDKPDFCGIWNMNFDIPYIIGRLERLGFDPKDILCHPDVPEQFKFVKYKEDGNRNMKNFGRKGSTHPSRFWDWVNISGYTQFYDQMSLYSIIRKRNILPSYKLDDIAEAETGYGKLDYTSLGYNIRNLAWQDFKIFLAYGGVDTIRLVQIEESTNDITKQVIFADNTKLSNSTKISFGIKNSMYKLYFNRESREIIGNNTTYTEREYLEGALVADPNLLRLKGEKVISGNYTNIYRDIIDMDFSSLYPSNILTFCVSKATIRGRIYELYENGLLKDSGTHIGENINRTLLANKTGLFDLMNKYFDLPNIHDMIKYIERRENV
jgi:hypothetical protein